MPVILIISSGFGSLSDDRVAVEDSLKFWLLKGVGGFKSSGVIDAVVSELDFSDEIAANLVTRMLSLGKSATILMDSSSKSSSKSAKSCDVEVLPLDGILCNSQKFGCVRVDVDFDDETGIIQLRFGIDWALFSRLSFSLAHPLMACLCATLLLLFSVSGLD